MISLRKQESNTPGSGHHPKSITMTSQWTRCRLKSPASRLFTQPFIQTQIKQNIKSSAALAFVRGIHRGPVNSPHKWPVTPKRVPFDDVITGLWKSMHNTAPVSCCGKYSIAMMIESQNAISSTHVFHQRTRIVHWYVIYIQMSDWWGVALVYIYIDLFNWWGKGWPLVACPFRALVVLYRMLSIFT